MLNTSNEIKIATYDVLHGGSIEVWRINGFYCVKSNVNNIIKWSECVNEAKANFYVFDATHYGCLDF